MPLIAFDELPDDARLWTFAASHRLTEHEAVRLLAATEAFLADWAAHRTPLATAHEWRYNQFLFVAVDETAAGASGCSIDTLVRFVRELERQFKVRFTDHASVWFRALGGAIQCATREEFQRLVDEETVGELILEAQLGLEEVLGTGPELDLARVNPRQFEGPVFVGIRAAQPTYRVSDRPGETSSHHHAGKEIGRAHV